MSGPPDPTKKIGQYVLLERIGRGGMGSVYRAVDEPLGRHVALKVLAPELAADPECRARFLREGKTAASDQSHPRIVSIHNLVDQGEVLGLAMELVEGGSLEAVVKAEGALPERVALDYLLQAADGLENKATRGIIHRDIKPANLLVDPVHGIKITDFGVSLILGSANRLTQADAVMGTPSYMSPEQGRGDPDLDHRSDIYALGCTLHFMINALNDLRRRLNPVPPPPQKPRNPRFPGQGPLPGDIPQDPNMYMPDPTKYIGWQ